MPSKQTNKMNSSNKPGVSQGDSFPNSGYWRSQDTHYLNVSNVDTPSLTERQDYLQSSLLQNTGKSLLWFIALLMLCIFFVFFMLHKLPLGFSSTTSITTTKARISEISSISRQSLVRFWNTKKTPKGPSIVKAVSPSSALENIHLSIS